jgi:hypothetical protein
MTTPPIIGAAVAAFVVAALLYFQSHNEGFTSEQKSPTAGSAIGLTPPVAGRPYGANSSVAYDEPLPADLNKTPPPGPPTPVPSYPQRPSAIPGPGTAPKEAMAQRKDLYQLRNNIMIWLNAAAQRETERPGSLTPEQLQRRVMLQARLASAEEQLGTGIMTDTYRAVSADINHIRRENEGWKQAAPSAEFTAEFGENLADDAFLDKEHYGIFNRLFDANLREFKNFIQPDPLQRVRLQQLQMMRQELEVAERRYNGVPPIRVAAARLYLTQMGRPDQPLPSLISIDRPTQQAQHPLSANPMDVIGQLKDMAWRLTVNYNPAQAALQRSIAQLLDRAQTGAMTPDEVNAARSHVVAMQSKMVAPHSQQNPTLIEEAAPLRYDPNNLHERAEKLCEQTREAFGRENAAALGCPTRPIQDKFEAETTINTVCNRIRTSVPTVTPEQFNCPRRNV